MKYRLCLLLGVTYLIILLFSGLTACTPHYAEETSPPAEEIDPVSNGNQEIQKNDANNEQSAKDEEKEILISAVGDLMVHAPQLEAQYNSKRGTYDFTNNFQYVKPYIERADLALANLETVLAGEGHNFTGFPLFNSPDELADALKYAGFQVISTANNHSYDRGLDGITRTLSVLEDRDLNGIGTRRNLDENSYIVKDVQGMRVGLSAFTYETPRINNQRSINGIPLSDQAAELIDSFSYEELDTDLEKMLDRIHQLRDEGADLVIFFMHWGTEYQREPNTHQKKLAEKLIDGGVDIILGSHPHVVQPMTLLETPSGREGLVVYSMGNFLSNQREKYLNRPYTEDGVITHIRVKKCAEGNLSYPKVGYTPTWVHRFQQEGQHVYHILPLRDAIDHPTAFNIDHEKDLMRAENSYQNTQAVLKEKTVKKDLPTPVHSLFSPDSLKEAN